MEKESGVPRMVSLREAAKQTGLSYDFLRKAVLKNEIVHVKCGKKYLVNLDKLAEKLNG